MAGREACQVGHDGSSEPLVVIVTRSKHCQGARVGSDVDAQASPSPTTGLKPAHPPTHKLPSCAEVIGAHGGTQSSDTQITLGKTPAQ